MDAALIARFLPGLGDPMKLNIVQFNGYLERLPAIMKISRGNMTTREIIDMEAGIGSAT